MIDDLLDPVPDDRRDAVRAALSATCGTSASGFRLDRVSGGASGALIYRAESERGSYLLRIEGPRSPFRNPHQYTCMQTAAEAGIAPAIRYLDADAGVVVMDCIASRPLADYPGGPEGVARALGQLVSRLQQTTPFPELRDYTFVLERLLGFLRSVVFAPGVLDAHADGYARIREAYPWDVPSRVSSHNDPNPRNILFDGDRLWLIDWETAYRNDPLTDVAILTENHAAAPDLQEALLESWLGHPSDRVLEARLLLMRGITRLYYAALLSTISMKAPELTTDLAAPSPEEFKARVSRGELKPGSSEAVSLLGKMMLAGFLARVSTPEFEDALKTVRLG